MASGFSSLGSNSADAATSDTAASASRRTYTLCYEDDAVGIGKRVEFEATNAAVALEIALGEADGRRALLLESGRPLCRLQKAAPGDATFWIVAADVPPPNADTRGSGVAMLDGSSRVEEKADLRTRTQGV
jgi:hypothetical protein